MTKEELFKMLDKAIDDIGEHFCEEDCFDMLSTPLQNSDLPKGWALESGISKAVILIPKSSYVLKLPFRYFFEEEYYSDAYYDWEKERDEILTEAYHEKVRLTGDQDTLLTVAEKAELLKEVNSREPKSEDFYTSLEGATNCDIAGLNDYDDWNYCNLECAIYEEAVKQGLGAYFAEEGFLGELSCGHPVYYQQRCVPMSEMHYKYSGQEYESKSIRSRTVCDKIKMYCFNPIWINDFIDIYGEEELARLNTFIEEMDIGDLRECNIGYLDGAPILFDYSGFRYWD